MPDEDETDQQPDDPAGLRDLIKKLQRENKELRPQAQTGTEAIKKLAIYEAGVTDPKTVKLLAKVHDGEWTPEAVKETITEYGFGATSASEGDGKTTADERQQAIADLGSVASGTRGTSDTRRPAANDDEALQEKILEYMAKEMPGGAKPKDQQAYLAGLTQIMDEYQVRRS